MHEEFTCAASGEDGPLTVSLAGISWCDGSYRIRRAAQKMTVIEYVESGSGTLIVEDRKFYPASGDVYIAPAWKTHSYASSAQRPWVKYWMNLCGPLVSSLLDGYGLAETYLFRDAAEAGEFIRRTVIGLKDLPAEQQTAYLEENFFHIVRALAGAERAQKRQDTRNPEINALLSYLSSCVLKPMPQLDEIAAVIGHSRTHTIRIFKQHTGQTPYHYLLQRKMTAAAEMVQNTSMPVHRIAHTLGFEDELYFSRLFRSFHGIAPRGMRRQMDHAEP